MVKAYKIVKVLKNGSRVSCLVPKKTGLRKTYQANGENIIVDQGMVFKSEKTAISFMKKYQNEQKFELWECKAQRIRSSYRHVAFNIEAVEAASNEILKGLREAVKYNYANNFLYCRFNIRGSYFAENIKLTRRIEI